jgi:hypothetical protein
MASEIVGFDTPSSARSSAPQGQFREFLSASSKDREDILKVLFDVRRCEELEQQLKAQVLALEKRREGRAAARGEARRLRSRPDLARVR